MWQQLKHGIRRLGHWLVAAASVLVTLFIAVLIYKYLTATPTPPDTAQCQRMQQLFTADQAAEVHLFQCQRGAPSNPWLGYEVWLYDVSARDWSRIATAPYSACLSLAWQRPLQLLIQHTGNRSEVYLARSSVIFETATGVPDTISIYTAALATCPE